MKYKQVYDLPEFMSFSDDGRLLIVKLSDDTFIVISADVWSNDDYEFVINDYALGTNSLLTAGLVTKDEAGELHAAERERTKNGWRKSELNNLLRLIRKFPDEAAELLPLPTSFEQPLTEEEKAQKRREAELADLANLMKLVARYPQDARDMLSPLNQFPTTQKPVPVTHTDLQSPVPDADLLEEYDNYPG